MENMTKEGKEINTRKYENGVLKRDDVLPRMSCLETFQIYCINVVMFVFVKNQKLVSQFYTKKRGKFHLLLFRKEKLVESIGFQVL